MSRYHQSTTATAMTLFIAAVFTARPAAAQSDPLAGFDNYVEQAVQDWGATGLAVAVVRDGEVVFERGYGVLELGKGQPVDEHTRFAIGSTTKAMTAAAIGMLVDQGDLSWDDPVIDHLPWFRLSDPALTREVRVRDLLTHNVGLPNADFLWYEQDRDPLEIIRALRWVEPAYSLRSGFIYQNLMYATAGHLIGEVSGMSWDDFIRTRIFEPLAMTESVTRLADTRGQPNVATPHYLVDGEVVPIQNASVDPVAAAGSIWSSVHDMSLWVRFLLAGGVTESGDRLLKESTFAELFRPQAILGTEDFYPTQSLTNPHWMTYGLGWFQGDYEGRKVDFHTGSIDGMVAIAGLIRDEDVGVYVLANRDHVEVRHALMYRVFDLYDADPPRDWSAELKTLYDGMAAQGDSARQAAESQRIPDTQPSLSMPDYAGTYSDRLYGTAEVTEVDGGLRLSYGRLTGPLEHWHHDTFRVLWDTRWRGTQLVQFELDTTGAVAAVVMGGSRLARSSPG